MLKIKNITIPASEEQEEEFFCDLCGKEIEDQKYVLDDQGIVSYNEHYSNYGSDGGDSTSYYFDLCNNCIKNKVFPLIENKLKIKPRKDENSW